jgi:hypothetical protein
VVNKLPAATAAGSTFDYFPINLATLFTRQDLFPPCVVFSPFTFLPSIVLLKNLFKTLPSPIYLLFQQELNDIWTGGIFHN